MVELPKLSEIKLEIETVPVPNLKVRANGMLLGLVRKLSNGYTFTSDEIGSFLLPPETHTDDIPKLVLDFISQHSERWIEANTKVNTDELDE